MSIILKKWLVWFSIRSTNMMYSNSISQTLWRIIWEIRVVGVLIIIVNQRFDYKEIRMGSVRTFFIDYTL